MADDLTPALWRKSSYSNSQGACIEVAELSNRHRWVRDSKDPAGPALRITAAQWSAFTVGVRAGELN